MEVSFLPATDQDRWYIADVLLDALPLYEPLIPGAFERQARRLQDQGLPRDYQLEIIYGQVEDGSVGLQAEKPLGFVGTRPLTETIFYLPALYLAADYWGQGWGKAVLSALSERMGAAGAAQLVLLVHGKAHWAKSFYEKNGFSLITDEIEAIKRYGDGKMTGYALPGTLLMGKSLLGSAAKKGE